MGCAAGFWELGEADLDISEEGSLWAYVFL
jgi:hypothetical protein